MDIRILITGCGRHSKDLVKSLKNNPYGDSIYVAGINNSERNILREEVDTYSIAPSITDFDYVYWLIRYCEENDIDIIMPYITAELPVLARNKELIESKGIKVSVASSESLAVANNKIRMYDKFSTYMPLQIVATTSDDIKRFANEIGYSNGKKLCCKLSDKCGGTGFAILDEEKYLDISTFNKVGVNRYLSLDQLCEIVDKTGTKVILQEYVGGTDYSVCVLADNGMVKYKCGFAGYSMEYGAVTNGEILYNEEAYRIADEITKQLRLDGNACYDFIVPDSGNPVLLECNPRINATIPFLAKAGADLAFYRCRQLIGAELPESLDINYGLKMVKYYESFYYK